jgi:hypothetical protein
MNKNYAIIKDSVVQNIIIIDTDIISIEEIKTLHEVDEVIEVNLEDYSNVFHFVPGATYFDSKFKRPKPYPSWVFDETLNDWSPAVPFPGIGISEDGETVIFPEWDEETLSWITV